MTEDRIFSKYCILYRYSVSCYLPQIYKMDLLFQIVIEKIRYGSGSSPSLNTDPDPGNESWTRFGSGFREMRRTDSKDPDPQQ